MLGADAWTLAGLKPLLTPVAEQWFFLTLAVVLGRVLYLIWEHNFGLSMVWLIKLMTDPLPILWPITPVLTAPLRDSCRHVCEKDNPMSPWFVVVAAVLLSLERIAYVVIWRAPDTFCTFCARPAVRPFGEPIDVLQKLFYGFKALQLAVFFGWCYVYGEGKLWPPDSGGIALCVGALLIVAGQLLNYSVFAQLGKVGVFYGNKMGYEVPWCREFPFSVLNHPQYIGASLSFWGFFLVMRFPYGDWYVLPAIETLYYALGAHFEQ